MPDARHANLLEPEALVELFLRHPPQGFAAASEADLPVFGTDFDLLTTLEPAILVKIRRLPLFGLWSRLLRFPARFAGTTATEYAPLPKGLEPGALLDGFRERCAAGQSLLIVKDVPEVSPLLGAGDNEAAMRLARIAPDKGFIVVEGQALAYVPIDFSSTDEYLSRLSKSRRKNLRRKLKSRERLDIEAVPLGDARFQGKAPPRCAGGAVRPLPRRLRPERNPFRPADAGFLRGAAAKPGDRRRGILLPP